MDTFNDVASDTYEASDKPFDFIPDGGRTALICEPDPSIRVKIMKALRKMDYHITKSASAQDALREMRFHLYDVVVLNEYFDTEDPNANDVLEYLKYLPVNIRRNIYVALVSDRFRTMDNMASLADSVNLVINKANIDDVDTIIKRGIADNKSFYLVFKESLRKTGRH